MKKLICTLGIGIAVALITTLLSLTNPLNSWHLKLSNSLFTRNNPSDQIVIIAIDDASISDDETNGLGRFYDWPRTFYQQALSQLKKAGAKTVGFDLLFVTESETITRDQLLNTINTADGGLSQALQAYDPFLSHPNDLILAESLNQNVILAAFPDKLPIPIFTEKAQTGFINVDRADEDSLIRRIPLKDSFSLKIAKTYDNQIDEFSIPTENDNLLINYFAPSYSFKQISFTDIYHNNFDPKDIEGKIVLIGPMSPRIAQDFYSTPRDPKIPMPGVEIHANAIQTILSGDYLNNQQKAYEIVIIFILALLLAFTLAYLSLWIGIAVTIAAVAGYVGYANVSYLSGIIPNMIYPFVAIALTFISSVIYKYFAELREKTYIKSAFSRYMNTNVMNEVLKDPSLLHLGGMNKNVTVFFSDIANFTSVSENLEPQELVKMINEYLSLMTDVILSLGGTLDKYVGDAIVAYFGAPLDQPDHAIKACAAALTMREKLPELHKKWQAKGLPLIDFRVGINTGFVVVGNVGSEKRFDYTIMGDEVNLGSRLEGANKKYGSKIMISEATLKLLGENFRVRELDLLRVKGKKRPVRVYELLARTGKLSETGRELLKRYNEGLSLYKDRNFARAYEAFKLALAIYQEDAPSKLYAERSEILSKFPPADDWDGVFTMHEK